VFKDCGCLIVERPVAISHHYRWNIR